MCGIVGIIQTDLGGVSDRYYEVFNQMLIANALRGQDGTGVFAATDWGASKTLKVSGHPFNLLNSPEYEKWTKDRQKKSSRFIIGHNRLATTGKKTLQNAHPFVHKHITMVHNGTLDKFSTDLDLKKYEVDSEALCASIAEDGIDKAMSKTAGAWAIIFHNSQDNTLNILRNFERPLFFCRDQFFNRILLASEPGMMQWIIDRNGLGKDLKPAFVPGNTLHTISLSGVKTGHKTELHIESRSLVGKPQASHGTGGSSPIASGSYPPTKAQKRLAAIAPPHQKKASKENVTLPSNKIDQKQVTTPRGTFVKTPALNGIFARQTVAFKLDDLIIVDAGRQRHLVIGRCTKNLPNSKNIRFMFYLNGNDRVESFWEVGYCRGFVQQILADITPDRKTEDRENIVWVSNAVAIGANESVKDLPDLI